MESLSTLWTFITNLFAAFIVALPWLLVFLGIPAVIVLVIVFSARKRRKARREAKKNAE